MINDSPSCHQSIGAGPSLGPPSGPRKSVRDIVSGLEAADKCRLDDVFVALGPSLRSTGPELAG